MPAVARLWCLLLMAAALFPTSPADACDAPVAICGASKPGALALIDDGKPLKIISDAADVGVQRALKDLSADFDRVAGAAPAPEHAITLPAGPVVIVGTIGRSTIIDRLVREGRLDVSGVAGQWEAYVQQVVEDPAAGVPRALVIAGADKRGTIFGIYDLSQAIGVSPWHWWADVPPQRHRQLYVLPGRRAEKPAVRYRGIFINDEDPALGGWARETFGGANSKFYERVFELILRQRGNFLWPAMWGRSLWEDDPASARLANEMGVVLGTSHHEPMMRAHVDWERNGEAPWDYTKNAERLRRFWREGLERTRGNEQLVTVGMRGDGDEPMTEGTATALLERIVGDQRKIIEEVSGRPAAETPQVWALYKEVQDYYDAGMRVPDDVTLLFSDDNWGNIRRLPAPGAERAGGYGIYYHFDYVGGPRNYKWLNTNQIERVWEQMHLAYEFGARRMWIVNVGDIKPMEFPTSFFLDMAWDADDWPVERLTAYPQRWAERQFGTEHAAEIGELVTRYAQYAARRKPELLAADTYSYDEWERVIREWDTLEAKATALEAQMAQEARDAYFQLVLHPIIANANLHRLYFQTAKARRREPGAADEARRLFAKDREIRRRYEEQTAEGKWRQMMAQTHIGYTSWQQPDRDVMPDLSPVFRRDHASVIGWHVAVEAEHYDRAVGVNGIAWRTIPNLGLTRSGVAAFPVTAPAQKPGASPYLEYIVDVPEAGEVELQVTLSPTLDFKGQGGLRYAVSVGDEPSQVVNVHAATTDRDWNRAVSDNRWMRSTRHRVAAPGRQRVRLWLVDTGLVFQRLVIAKETLPPSYLGPPETARR